VRARQLRAQHLGVAVLAGQARAAARHAGGHRAQSKVPVAMVNQVGGNDSLVFDGSSRVIAPDGRVVAQGSRLKKT